MTVSPSHNQDEPKYSRAGNVRARFGGVSDMWITRRMRDDGFPQPVYFGTKERFWKDDDLVEWERAMIQRGLKESKRTAPPSRKLGRPG